ncbi:MAG: glycosyl hydrolase [Flammeovirgaceae bacterium]|nr:glycosyl hydrolase [Flammeovirgaceae bacterium]
MPIMALLLGVVVSPLLAQTYDPETFKAMKYRFIGPEGNRAIAIVGEPGNPMVNYIGAASGGLWKTEDGGVTWKSIFDGQEVSSVGSIALAPTDPTNVWVGTGETFIIRPAHSVGNGIYLSQDAGKTWKNMGLEKTGRIGRVVVHPKNKNIVYAAALGHVYGPQQERGVYRTKDGGKTWERVLFVDEGTGAADLAIDPQNPNILYAAMWTIHINTWGLRSGGPGGGIYRSTDGGDTWEPLNTKGLPGGKDHIVGKTAVAIAQSNPKRVYALFEDKSPALYRTDDGGEHWELVSNNHDMAERAPYYTRMTVSTDNPDEIYFMSVRFSQSLDGGKTLEKRPPRGGGDNHDIWIDPLNADRMMVAHDGCASISLNRGKTFQRVVLPIAQMYHVEVDNQIPYFVYGNRQDGWSYRGPSNSLQGYIPLGLWKGVGGCESGFARPDPFDNNIIWSGCYDGGLQRHDLRTGHSREVRVWPEAGYGWAPADLKYRWHWNFPLSHSPHTRHRVYVGSQYVHKSDDEGQSWQVISPDLTTNDKTHQQSSGGIAVDNLMTFDGATLFAIEESKVQKDLIWTGSNDGQVNLTQDGGKTWTNVSKNINMPPWGTIANIEPSRFDSATAYIAVDMHQMGDFDPYIFKTTDYGKTWAKISNGIPKSILSFVHVVREDPKQKGLLYAGTDNALYVSFDDGKNWMLFRNNMPPAPVYWLVVQENFDDLVVGTYGRGYYILDDISLLREFAAASQQSTYVFNVRKAYRFQEVEAIKTDAPSPNAGTNPPYGTPINYYLKDSLSNGVQIEVYDDKQELIRTLKGTNQAGINRVWWDLRYEPTFQPRLRTRPPGRPWVEMNGEGWRPLVTWDLDLWKGQLGPRAAPGKYTAKIKMGDKEFTETFDVLKDPNTTGTEEEIQEQVMFSLQLRDAMNTVVEMIDRMEWIRKELGDLIPITKNAKLKKELLQMEEQAQGISARLYDIHLTGAREDAFRSPMKLYGRLSALASDITANGVDFRPTNQQGEVYGVLKGRMVRIQQEYNTLLEKQLPQINNKLPDQKINIEKKN